MERFIEWLEGVIDVLVRVLGARKAVIEIDRPKIPSEPYTPAPQPLPTEQSTPVDTPDPEPLPDPPRVPAIDGQYPKGYRVPLAEQKDFLSKVGLPNQTPEERVSSIKKWQNATTWHDLVADGVPGPKTAQDWDKAREMGYRVARTWSLYEFMCRCIEYEVPGKPKGTRYPDCTITLVNRDDVLHVQRSRDKLYPTGTTLNSATRCPQHNKQQGGAKSSQHLRFAADWKRIHPKSAWLSLNWSMLGLYGGKVGHTDNRSGSKNRSYVGS